ncbi:MAG TPA: SH3 domain-containing protein [Oligoflexia bacterium]|nr:SH3 domain-containing protein [Oligoflexia bacterium]HMP27824.1 SH3 domain-containing protein [Oligoflexia bacterium]
MNRILLQNRQFKSFNHYQAIRYYLLCLLTIAIAGNKQIFPGQIAYAQENTLLKIHIKDVQSSLLKTDLTDHFTQNPTSQPEIISETDLEAARARLIQAESELLGKPSSLPANLIATTQSNDRSIAPSSENLVAENNTEQQNNNDQVDQRAALNISTNTISNNDAATQENKSSISSEIISSLREQNIRLSSRLQEAQSKNSELIKTLDETRNRLMLAETQVERLSAILENRGAKIVKTSPETTVGKTTHPSQQPSINIISRRPATNNETFSQEKTRESSSAASIKIADRVGANIEIPIATVIADKVNLRTGPGRDNSPLMSVSKGTRLAVETRVGDWFRVIAPNGTRAWIESEVIVINGSR